MPVYMLAAKRHKCQECGRLIRKGEFHVRTTHSSDGVLGSYYHFVCLRCVGVERLFSPPLVADILGLSPYTINQRCRNGKVAGAKKPGFYWQIPVSYVKDQLDTQAA